MNGYYAGKVKVVGPDLMCFPAHAQSLDPLACSCYDPYAWSDPDPEPIETIGFSEWQSRRDAIAKSSDFYGDFYGDRK